MKTRSQKPDVLRKEGTLLVFFDHGGFFRVLRRGTQIFLLCHKGGRWMNVRDVSSGEFDMMFRPASLLWLSGKDHDVSGVPPLSEKDLAGCDAREV